VNVRRIRAMRRHTIALIVLFGLVQASPASDPESHEFKPSGVSDAVPDQICWIQVYDCEGSQVTSEVSSSVNIMTEVAHDFGIGCEYGARITRIFWWGRGLSDSWPEPPCFNIFFYTDDGACCPDEVLAAYLHVTPSVTEICDGEAWQHDLHVDLDIVTFTRYWVVFQANSHGLPPQWGILQTTYAYDCMSMFRSAHFGYPDWVPVDEVIGHPFDGAFALECDCPWRTARAQSTTWGALKSLFD
jgi:hypothetical protein